MRRGRGRRGKLCDKDEGMHGREERSKKWDVEEGEYVAIVKSSNKKRIRMECMIVIKRLEKKIEVYRKKGKKKTVQIQ